MFRHFQRLRLGPGQQEQQVVGHGEFGRAAKAAVFPVIQPPEPGQALVQHGLSRLLGRGGALLLLPDESGDLPTGLLQGLGLLPPAPGDLR